MALIQKNLILLGLLWILLRVYYHIIYFFIRSVSFSFTWFIISQNKQSYNQYFGPGVIIYTQEYQQIILTDSNIYNILNISLSFRDELQNTEVNIYSREKD